jgi:hypothetical protein
MRHLCTVTLFPLPFFFMKTVAGVWRGPPYKETLFPTLSLFENCCRGMMRPSMYCNIIPYTIVIWNLLQGYDAALYVLLHYSLCHCYMKTVAWVWCGILCTITLFPIPLLYENCCRGMMRPSMYCNIIPYAIVIWKLLQGYDAAFYVL